MIARTFVDEELVREETLADACGIYELVNRTGGVATALSKHGREVYVIVEDDAGETFPQGDRLVVAATPWGVLMTFMVPRPEGGLT